MPGHRDDLYTTTSCLRTDMDESGVWWRKVRYIIISHGHALSPCYKAVSLDKIASFVFSTSGRLAIMSLSFDSITGVDEDLPVTRHGECVRSPLLLDPASLHAHLCSMPLLMRTSLILTPSIHQPRTFATHRLQHLSRDRSRTPLHRADLRGQGRARHGRLARRRA